MVNPCFCGCTLQQATKIIAIINIVSNAIMACFMIVGTVLAIISVSQSKNHDSSDIGLLVGSLIIGLIFRILGILLAILLLRGSNERNQSKVRTWLIVSVILLILNALSFFGFVRQAPASNLGMTAATLLYQIFALWVAYEFYQELKLGIPTPTNPTLHL